MGFSFEHSFVIKAPLAKVWAYLTDPYRVAPALPGASITEKVDDANYNGAIALKVGPVSTRFRGKVRFDTVDAALRTVQMVASGQETSGRGGADMRMQSRLIEKAPCETEVSVTSEVTVTGILAQFGRGMIQDVSNQMFRQFSESVRAELEKSEATEGEPASPPAPPSSTAPVAASTAVAPAPSGAPPSSAVVPAPSGALPSSAAAPAPMAGPSSSPPIDVVALGGKVMGRAAARALRRPMFWIVVALVFAVVWFLYR
jgi:carbon monoxide dehydrogenase subunit G